METQALFPTRNVPVLFLFCNAVLLAPKVRQYTNKDHIEQLSIS